MFVIVTALLAIIGIVLAIYYFERKQSNPPPGPWNLWALPILGHLPLLGKNPAKTLLKWREKYGPIISVKLGNLNSIVLNDFKTAKEASSMSSLSGRKVMSYFPEATHGKGIIFASGPSVFEQRRYAVKAMRDFGLRSGHIETVLQAEISELLNSFKAKSGRPMKIHHAFNFSMVNALWITLTGKRFEDGDPNLNDLANTCSRILEVPTGFGLIAYFVPWLAKLLPNLSGYNSGLQEFRQLTNYMQTQITELNSSRVKNDPRNLTDAYLDKVESTTDENSSFFPAKNMIPFTFGDLFLGAIDTTSTLQEWTLLYLAVHQDVQRRLQNEIFEVTGNVRAPRSSDRSSMPYADAVIHEVIRKAPLVSFNVAKEAMEDTTFRNYTIPKGTAIFVNFYALYNDPAVWGDPENFRPERFIDERGNFIKFEGMIPFGWGKRACVGESLARDQSFLYVTNFFQKFNVSCPPGKEVNLEEKFSFVVHPDKSNEIVLTERF